MPLATMPAAAALAMLISPVPVLPSPVAADVSSTPVTVQSQPSGLRGTVMAPNTPGGRRPAVVIVHGAGPHTWSDYEAEARVFAEAGIVTLVYDKRTDGYSLTNRSFDDLAGDALAAVEVLRARPDVDPDRVGLLGRSEGGWVAPLAASRTPKVAFVITVGASGLPPARTQVWSNVTHLEHAGITGSLWAPLGVNFTRVLAGAGMFGAANYDPLPSLQRVHQPVLGVFAQYDRSTAPGESAQMFADTLQRSGNRNHSIRVVPGTNHNLHVSPDGFVKTGRLAPAYVELVTSWITDQPPSTSDEAPAQSLDSTPLRPLAWYESVPVQAGALALMLAAFLAYPIGALVNRFKRRRHELPGRRAARVVAGFGPLTVLGAVGYVGYLTATGTQATGPVFAARPVAWLILQLLAAAVITAAAVLGVSWWRNRRPAAFAPVLAGSVAFLPWAAYWGLLTV